MREVFWVMLSLSLSGAGLAAVVALLQRLLAKRLPAGLFYGLWAAVLLRMTVPAGPLGGVSHEAVSVSYTHLDVYKRQPRRRTEGRRAKR